MPKTLPIAKVESAIHTVRGMRVMLDSDLAAFYGVETKRLLEQVRRNKQRFPEDFAFQLGAQEFANLRSQIATSSLHGGRRTLPWVFTEHGLVMLASVLNSKIAIEASIVIVRVFVQMQRAGQIAGGDLIAKLSQIDRCIEGHDDAIQKVLEALNALFELPPKPEKEVGFHTLMEDLVGCPDLMNGSRRGVRYEAKRRARTNTPR